MKCARLKSTLILLTMLTSLFISWTAFAGKQYDVNDFTFHFVLGDYHVVGKKPGNEKTYAGRVTISRKGDFLRIKRCIEGKVIVGSGAIKKITSDEIPVLNYYYKRGDTTYEGHYEISGDINNYARLGGPYVDVKLQGLVGWEFLYVDARNSKPCK
ncbi:MAG: hypothetical protein OEV42_11250 [Deltaproteobacteria bacterium]|nr:hypothetical protein [Deltaproteobacteria bacterium]